MKIVVDGATSMLGVALIKKCIEKKYEVLAGVPVSNFVKIVNEDETLSLADDPYEAYYHFAWNGTSKEQRQDLYAQEKNILMTIKAVEYAHKLHCKYFFGAGSQAEYGITKGKISEETPTRPNTYYGICKSSSYLFAKKRCEELGLTCIWPRIFSVYGCNDGKSTMISYAIDSYMKGEIAIFSKADNTWNYLFEDDAAKILLRLYENSANSGIYNIANVQSQVLKGYILDIAEVLGKNFNFKFSDTISPINLDVDMSKTINATGIKSFVSFKYGIKQILKSRSIG